MDGLMTRCALCHAEIWATGSYDVSRMLQDHLEQVHPQTQEIMSITAVCPYCDDYYTVELEDAVPRENAALFAYRKLRDHVLEAHPGKLQEDNE